MQLDENMIREHCIPEIERLWLSAPDSFPAGLEEIPAAGKSANEKYIEDSMADFRRKMAGFPSGFRGRKAWKRDMLGMLSDALGKEDIFGVHTSMDTAAVGEIRDQVMEFLRRARKFSPELPVDGIGQAIRNYIVYVMFVRINGLERDFSTACFGYSMLYPFTDNFIDSPDCTDEDKFAYNLLIRDTIEGRRIRPRTQHQKKTCALLRMIESEYPRESGSEIFLLLRLMLDAQEESLRQQKRTPVLTPEERLRISVFKGGMSVLIDRFFINREITGEDLRFYMGFGFFLQLCDDLQDIAEDSRNGGQTLFTQETAAGAEEKIVNKLLHFLGSLSEGYRAEDDGIKAFFLSNCYRLVYSSLAGSRKFFSGEYVEKVERHYLLSFAFLDRMKENMAAPGGFGNPDQYLKMIDELVK